MGEAEGQGENPFLSPRLGPGCRYAAQDVQCLTDAFHKAWPHSSLFIILTFDEQTFLVLIKSNLSYLFFL